jgi:hypothetical protein
VTTTLLPVALTTILILLILLKSRWMTILALTFLALTLMALTFANSTSGRMVAATLPLTGIGLTLL